MLQITNYSQLNNIGRQQTNFQIDFIAYLFEKKKCICNWPCFYMNLQNLKLVQYEMWIKFSDFKNNWFQKYE